MIRALPPMEIQGHVSSGLGNASHPMRLMTRRVAGLSPGLWDAEAGHLVTQVFDDLAGEWHIRSSPQRTKVVEDALVRGVEPLLHCNRLAIEVGSGVGTYTSVIASRFGSTVSLDLSAEMLRNAPAASLRVRADGGAVPIASSTVDAVVLVNAFLFPDEVDRLLKPGGLLVWVNSSGEETPIHLSTSDVVKAVPFAVDGVEAKAGVGTWCVLRRLG